MTALLWLLLFLAVLGTWLLAPSTALLSAWIVLLAAPVLSWLLLWPLRRKQGIQLKVPATAGKRKPFPLTITFPRHSLPLGSALVWLEVENTLTGEILRQRMRVSGEAEWTLCSQYCGALHCRVTRVWALDSFGLLPLPFPCRSEQRITVMPDTFPVEAADLRSLTPTDQCQDYAPDRRGQDLSEPFQIREYLPGDNLHQIHWKLSSKTDTLLVREPSCPVDHSLLVFVERRYDTASPRCADALLEAAISVCQALVETGIPFHLAWNEAQLNQYSIAGEEQLPEAAAALLHAPPIHTGPYGCAMYQRSGEPLGCVLYFCHQLPPAAEAFPNDVQTFLCTEQDSPADAVHFTPDTMQEVLRCLKGGALLP